MKMHNKITQDLNESRITLIMIIMEELTNSSNTNRLGLITLMCGVIEMSEKSYTELNNEVCKTLEAQNNKLFLTKGLLFYLKGCEEVIEANYYLSVLRALISIWLLCPSTTPTAEDRARMLNQIIFGTNSVQSTYSTLRSYYSDTPGLAKKIKKFSTAVMGELKNNDEVREFRSICRAVGVCGALLKKLMDIKYNFIHHDRGTRRCKHLYFLYSINMMKRGLSRLPSETVMKELGETIVGLNSQPLPLEDNAKIAIKFAVDHIWDQANWEKKDLNNFINQKFNVPSFSSTFEYNKGKGGGKRLLWDARIRNRQELRDQYCDLFSSNKDEETCLNNFLYDYDAEDMQFKFINTCRFAALVEPNKVRPITIQSASYQFGAIPMKEFLLETWKRTSYGTMFEGWEEKILDFDYSPDHTFSSVDYTAATNKMKPEATLCCLVEILKKMEPLWSNKEVSFSDFAQFQIECVGMRTFELDSAVEICGANKQCPVSVIDESELIGYVNRFRDKDNQIDNKEPYCPQYNGQLMGNPLSFVLLCTINLASVMVSYAPQMLDFKSIQDWANHTERDNVTDFNDFLYHIIINGDDAVYRYESSDPELPERQKHYAKLFGLEVNELKTWVNSDYLSLNSQIFYFHNRELKPTKVGYLNQSILWNNNIKNMNGIDNSNIAMCTEYMYLNGPEKEDENLTYFWDHVLAYVPDGDCQLAEEFFDFHSILRLKKQDKKYPRAGINDGGLGFNIDFPFLKDKLPKLKVKGPTVHIKNMSSSTMFRSEQYQEILMIKATQLLTSLIESEILIECSEEEGCSSTDLTQNISDYLHRDYQYVHFGDAKHNLVNSNKIYTYDYRTKYKPLESIHLGDPIYTRDELKRLHEIMDIHECFNKFHSEKYILDDPEEELIVGTNGGLAYKISNPFFELDDETDINIDRGIYFVQKMYKKYHCYLKINPEIYQIIERESHWVPDPVFDIVQEVHQKCGFQNLSKDIFNLLKTLLLQDTFFCTDQNCISQLMSGTMSCNEKLSLIPGTSITLKLD